MTSFDINQSNGFESERQRAIATTRMINYASEDAEDLGLTECSQLLKFVAEMIRFKFKIPHN